MATALAKGWLAAGLVETTGLFASDVVGAAREAFEKETGGKAFPGNSEVLKQEPDVVLLAVKPHQIVEVLHECHSLLDSKVLLVSIAAGVKLDRLEDLLPSGARCVRVMPNTPALVGASASAFALGDHASAMDRDLVHRLFAAVGVSFEVKEAMMDAVTGLSGSGPAYGYMMIEALSDGGVAEGLPRDVATRLAAQTLLGAAQMVLQTGMHPGYLKDMVTSPGGTTIEGVHALESGGLRAALMNAVREASRKARLLGKG